MRSWRAAAAVILMGFGAATAMASEFDGASLVVGRVSDDPKSAFPRIERFARHLSDGLGAFGFEKGAAFVAADNREMLRALRDGLVDVVSESPFSAMEFVAGGNAEVLLLEKRRGTFLYRSVFFSHKNGAVQGIADLKGRKIGFEDPGSSSAYRLPRAVLEAEGLGLMPVVSAEDQVPADKVGYLFLFSEVNIATAVARRILDAGALSDSDWSNRKRVPDRMREQLSLFHSSESFPRSLLLVRVGLKPELKERIRDILLRDSSDPAVSEVFHSYYSVGGYKRLDAQAVAQLRFIGLRVDADGGTIAP